MAVSADIGEKGGAGLIFSQIDENQHLIRNAHETK